MGILSSLTSGNVLQTVLDLLYTLPAVLIALTLHEYAHGFVAFKCGDDTAYMLGRLSFNPLKHLSIVGTACMILFGVGWAKPVPVNPRKFKRYKRDDIFVSAAGITMNLCLFLLASILYVICLKIIFPGLPKRYGQYFADINYYGYYSFLTGDSESIATYASYFRTSALWLQYFMRFLCRFQIINLSLAIFNLIPFPPLDGYRLVNNIFFRGRIVISENVMKILLVVFLAVNYATNFVSDILFSAITFVQSGVVGVLLKIVGLG